MRFRFIDRVVSFENGTKSQGDSPFSLEELSPLSAKLVTEMSFPSSDEYTEGHPQRPGEIPNCLLLETLATAGVRLVYAYTGEQVVGVLARVEEAGIYAPVAAGEKIVVHTRLLGLQATARDSVGLARTHGQAYVSEECVAESRLVLLCFPKQGFERSLSW